VRAAVLLLLLACAPAAPSEPCYEPLGEVTLNGYRVSRDPGLPLPGPVCAHHEPNMEEYP
jgi:hypothetical protein